MGKLIVTAIFCFSVLTSCFSQEFVFAEESLQDSRHHHYNQVWMVQLSLKENRLRTRIEFADGYDFQAEFGQLSGKFQQTIPTEYWNAKSRPHLMDTLSRIPSEEHFIRWTFGKIEKDKNVSFYGQLIVYFSDTSTSATVTIVKFKNTTEFKAPDSKKVLELYERFKENQLKNPPPPLPPIRGN